MKKLFLLLITMCCALAVEAQTLNIYQGSVCVGVSAADAADMTYDNGTTLTVAGRTYTIADIDSIVVNSRPVTAGQVEVSYSNGGGRCCPLSDGLCQWCTREHHGSRRSDAGSQLRSERHKLRW